MPKFRSLAASARYACLLRPMHGAAQAVALSMQTIGNCVCVARCVYRGSFVLVVDCQWDRWRPKAQLR